MPCVNTGKRYVSRPCWSALEARRTGAMRRRERRIFIGNYWFAVHGWSRRLAVTH
jgi:hypothetical protein